MGSRHNTTLATVEPIEYTGKVWCVTVPTGAFVARRNGQIFITGNSGFPKSLNIGKAVDRLQGNERESVGKYEIGGMTPDRENFGANDRSGGKGMGFRPGEIEITKGTSEWEGYGTALKPAHEPCVLARKPLDKGMTVAGNVLKHGTGGLNIDGTRVTTDENLNGGMYSGTGKAKTVADHKWGFEKRDGQYTQPTGRFPANLIHDGSDEVEAVFPQKSEGKDNFRHSATSIFGSKTKDSSYNGNSKSSYGSASRFFYTAKASKSERNAGLEGFEPQITNDGREKDIDNAFQRGTTLRSNHHPTVKPLSLTKYLATLIKPPTGGRLLVPFSGSGSEMIGALQAGWEYVEGVELTEEYIPIAEARIKYWLSVMAQEDAKPKQESLL